MTMDIRCCDIPIRARCKSGKQRPELKMYPNEVGNQELFLAKSNYYPTPETSKASGGVLPFFSFFQWDTCDWGDGLRISVQATAEFAVFVL